MGALATRAKSDDLANQCVGLPPAFAGVTPTYECNVIQDIPEALAVRLIVVYYVIIIWHYRCHMAKFAGASTPGQTKKSLGKTGLCCGVPAARRSAGRAAMPGGFQITARYVKDDLVDVDAVVEEFGMTKGALAQSLGFAEETFQRFSRVNAPKAQQRLRDFLEIIVRVEPWAGGPIQALGWYRAQSIPSAGRPDGRVARQTGYGRRRASLFGCLCGGGLCVRFRGLAYRAHNPRWSWAPTSGEGARLHGGRFNPKGVPALYLSLNTSTAILEATQGFASRFPPLT